MSPGPRELEERLQRRRDVRDLGIRRPTATHRHDHHLTRPCELPRDRAGHGGLPDPLPGPDDPERRQVERLECWRVEAKVGADVGQTRSEHATGEPKPFAWAEHRLVGEIDHDVDRREPLLQLLDQRYPVVLASAQLLGAARAPRRRHVVGQPGDRIPHDRRVVLSVNDDKRPRHDRVVTSPSIRAVYFSNSSVSIENWMIFSCPWNG